jgi:hypothetical protein
MQQIIVLELLPRQLTLGLPREERLHLSCIWTPRQKQQRGNSGSARGCEAAIGDIIFCISLMLWLIGWSISCGIKQTSRKCAHDLSSTACYYHASQTKLTAECSIRLLDMLPYSDE